MKAQYRCRNENRSQKVAASTALNGIDYIEVDVNQQTELKLYFLHPLPGQLNAIPNTSPLKAANLAISGGVRISGIQVAKDPTAADNVLTITVDRSGDFSWYTLRLVSSATDPATPPGFDSQLGEIEFSFKAGCPSDFDCKPVRECPPKPHLEPDLDYLAKDYASFRRLMFDRLRLISPAWRERHAADAQVAVVELLAYAADHLSYYQDAVGTEAYLGTARKRISVRRHARLLDYFMHEGCNARTWLFLEAEGKNIPVGAGAPFSTAGETSPPPGGEAAVVFETLHAATLQAAHNRIRFHTWSDSECCLPKGATRAVLKNDPALALNPGDLLLLEEERGPKTGNAADADPLARQVVRLTRVTPKTDLIGPEPVLEVEWDAADALTFPLCLSAIVPDQNGHPQLKDISIARGNIVLADHGSTIAGEELAETRKLAQGPLTHQGYARDRFGRPVIVERQLALFDPAAPASAAMQWRMRDALPSIKLHEDSNQDWSVQRDLLGADQFLCGFVAEIDEAGIAQLRFGDGTLGRKPSGKFTATYRVGNGLAGNVGAETIVRNVAKVSGISAVRNPLPAQGGRDPESLEEVRQFAPAAFRTQERAVTAADWAEVTQRHPDVQRAVARFRWTGSWTTVFVAIDRVGGKPVDAAFADEIRHYLDRYRIAGYDLEVNGPILVPLDIMMLVCVKPGYFRGDVEKALFAAFSNRDLPDGRRGYFHPDNFTFGQPVYLSQLYRLALQQPGVASVSVRRFQRWGKLPNGEIDDGRLIPGALEIVQLDHDANFPEHGRLELELHGGL